MTDKTLSQVVLDSLEGKGSNNKKSNLREFMSWLGIIVIAVLAALLLSRYVIINAQVTTGSMENTIITGDRVLGLRCVYWFSEPQRGDIVFFRYPDDESQIFVKRLIGLPGDTVEIIDGKTYVNGELLDEPYLAEEPQDLDFGPYVVPEGCYFMLGDNRNRSRDSRYWTNTYVTRDEILGKAYFVYYPTLENVSRSYSGE